MIIFPFTHRSPIARSSLSEKILPMGLCGVLSTIILVFGVMAASSSLVSKVHSEEEDVSFAPFSGGWRGT